MRSAVRVSIVLVLAAARARAAEPARGGTPPAASSAPSAPAARAEAAPPSAAAARAEGLGASERGRIDLLPGRRVEVVWTPEGSVRGDGVGEETEGGGSFGVVETAPPAAVPAPRPPAATPGAAPRPGACHAEREAYARELFRMHGI